MRFKISVVIYVTMAMLFATASSHAATCKYSFSTGKGVTYMQYCITANGTFVNFQSPQGNEMLDQGSSNEGYGICDENNGVGYWDYGDLGNSGNWATPALVSQTSSEVEITRTTADGRWVLLETITKEGGGSPYAKVVMMVQNRTGSLDSISLVRYAGFVPNGAASSGNYMENYGGTGSSVWGNTDLGPGMMLQHFGADTGWDQDLDYWQAGVQTTRSSPGTPCDFGSVVYVLDGLGAGALQHVLGVAPDKYVTVTDRYFAF